MNLEYIICHYGELALKGGNRIIFEKKLKNNIEKAISPKNYEWIKILPGRIVVKIKNFSDNQRNFLKEKLKKIPGIVYFSFASKTKPEINEIKREALKLVNSKKGKTFKIETKRSDKNFRFDSQKTNEIVGEYVLKNQKKKVNLKNPDVVCFIEIVLKSSFLYTEKYQGEGGMPTGTSGKVISLLSGGIDSPVASYFLIRRGAKAVFVHFHAYPFTKKQSLEKVKKIVEKLSVFQFESKIYFIPFANIQKEILLKCPEKLRIILYRRAMFKISEIIAEKEKALALVTGDSLSQVASQTLENIRTIDEATKLPVFRPLIGMDKNEIINLAKKIGTYEISIIAHQDCCSRFMPKNPETKSDLKKVKFAEKKLKLKKLIKEAIKKTEIEIVKENAY